MAESLSESNMRINSLRALTHILIAVGIIALAYDRQTVAQNNSDDPDPIISGAEVDKKAVIDKVRWDLNHPSPVGCKGRGIVIIRAVLRKSGKVTNITVIERGDCPKFEQKATRAVEKVKFTPAKKDGAPVSTYMQFEFNYNCSNAPGGECP
jgi:TonB family protein